MRSSFLFLLLIIAFGVALVPHAFAFQMSYVSDTISDSRNSTSSDHTILFRVPNAIPASGQLVIDFQGHPFSIDPAFDFTSVNFAYSLSSPTSSFVGRSLASTPDAVNDGVNGNAMTGPVNITLSSGSGIPANAYVRVIFGATNITNPSSTGSYRILLNTFSSTGTAIDYGAAMVAILPGVAVDVNQNRVVPAVISNGLPTGTIPSNINGVLLSVNTDVFSSCRYATSSGISYDSMTNSFTAISLGTFHYTTLLMSIVKGTTYNFYVRCQDFAGNKNPSDYIISFTGGDPTGTGAGGGAGGSSGGGGGSGGGPSYPPYPPGPASPSLVIQGIGLPNSKVSVLEDGAAISQGATTDNSGNFSITIPSLPQGTYSFTLYINDTAGNRISSRTMTLTVISGTANSIQGVVLPPSIAPATSTVKVGGVATLSGLAEPSSTITVWITSQTAAQSPIILNIVAPQSGLWSYNLHTVGFPVDTYQVRVESTVPGLAVSGFSSIAYVGVGTSPKPLTANPDLNGDGKVNLIDFSIFLFHWGQAYPPADFNFDGSVDLPDFSIMLFHWTG